MYKHFFAQNMYNFVNNLRKKFICLILKNFPFTHMLTTKIKKSVQL